MEAWCFVLGNGWYVLEIFGRDTPAYPLQKVNVKNRTNTLFLPSNVTQLTPRLLLHLVSTTPSSHLHLTRHEPQNVSRKLLNLMRARLRLHAGWRKALRKIESGIWSGSSRDARFTARAIRIR